MSALIDSGAGQSVIDMETVRQLGLETQLASKKAEIFGLAQEPVQVVGTLNLTVDLGNGQLLNHAFEVLDGALNPCILGCDLLAKFDATEFNCLNHRVRIAKIWKDSQFTIKAGEPLTRVYVLESIDANS